MPGISRFGGERRVRRRSGASGGLGRAELSSGGRHRGLQPVRRVRQPFDAVRHGDDRHNERKRYRDRRRRDGFEFQNHHRSRSTTHGICCSRRVGRRRRPAVSCFRRGQPPRLWRQLPLARHADQRHGLLCRAAAQTLPRHRPSPSPPLGRLLIVGFTGVGFFAARRAGKASSTSATPWRTKGARIEPGFRAGALAPGSRRRRPDAAKKISLPLALIALAVGWLEWFGSRGRFDEG